tara:strand:+ start:203 stop:463 length:261 start_codon:yes stop_codon:yes gene_type:complete
MELNRDQLKELRGHTWHNDHTGARLILAQHLKHTGLIKAYKAFDQLHSFFGHLPHNLSLFRRDLDKILFNVAKTKITNFKKVYECF